MPIPNSKQLRKLHQNAAAKLEADKSSNAGIPWQIEISIAICLVEYRESTTRMHLIKQVQLFGSM